MHRKITRHVNLQIFVAHFFGCVSHACAAAAAAVELQVLRREGETELSEAMQRETPTSLAKQLTRNR